MIGSNLVIVSDTVAPLSWCNLPTPSSLMCYLEIDSSTPIATLNYHFSLLGTVCYFALSFFFFFSFGTSHISTGSIFIYSSQNVNFLSCDKMHMERCSWHPVGDILFKNLKYRRWYILYNIRQWLMCLYQTVSNVKGFACLPFVNRVWGVLPHCWCNCSEFTWW